MARLAIISSYNENCGNASYTHVLKNEFSRFVEVDVIPLDLFSLQKKGRRLRGLGDDHIKSICERLRKYDYVNIQFEAGLYGMTTPDILRRVGWLIEASPNCVLTMHRIDPLSMTRREIIIDQIKRRKFTGIFNAIGRTVFERLYYDMILKCIEESKKKNVWINVHTRRERRIVQDYYKFPNCFDHPLAFLTPKERANTWGRQDRENFRIKHNFAPDAMVVGLFGYISEYKGLETAIQALPALPNNAAIALFGSQHPQSIQQRVTLDPYLEQIVDMVDGIADDIVKKQLKRINKLPKGAAEKIDSAKLNNLVNLSFKDRVRFMGNLDDPDFIEALRLCDAVVLPYLEVGQSMSGIIVLAIESGATMFCANNLSFFETRKYYGEVFHTFDIGNYMELAQKLRTGGDVFKERRDAAFEQYNIETLVAGYLSKFGFKTAGAMV